MSDEVQHESEGAQPGVSRRGLLLGGSAGLGLGVLGTAAGFRFAGPSNTTAPHSPASSSPPVTSRGTHQAGVVRPETPQRHCLIVVADLSANPTRDQALAAIRAAGDVVDEHTDPTTASADLLPDGPGDLTVTIGIGPRLVQAINPQLPGAQALPAFAGDEHIPAHHVGGDLLIAVYASDVNACLPVAQAVLDAVPQATLRWSQAGVRGAGEGTIARNPLGYHDGVIVPRTQQELDTHVWINGGPAAAGTVAVIRRLQLDIQAFRNLDVAKRDAIVGRTHRDGEPLSGGQLMDQANLLAKSPAGEYLVPQRSHIRAAHPSFTGSALMLRRSYGYSNATRAGEDADDGLLFICFQNDLDVFIRTQRRLDETDDLMTFARPTASASFLILPGRTGDSPLGANLG